MKPLRLKSFKFNTIWSHLVYFYGLLLLHCPCLVHSSLLCAVLPPTVHHWKPTCVNTYRIKTLLHGATNHHKFHLFKYIINTIVFRLGT